MPSRGRRPYRRGGSNSTRRSHPYARANSRRSRQESSAPSSSTCLTHVPQSNRALRHQRSYTGSSRSRSTFQSPLLRVEEDDDGLSEIVMAVNSLERGTIGCSYYVASTETLYIMNDMKFGDKELVERLKTVIDPTIILLPTRADDVLLDSLDPNGTARNVEGSNDPYALSYSIDFRPGSDFGHESAVNKLASINFDHVERILFSVPGESSRTQAFDDADDELLARKQERTLRLGGWLQADSNITIGCAGAVLTYLQRRRAARFMPNDPASHAYMRVTRLDNFTLKSVMHINSDTLRSLRIMDLESHPSSQNQGSKGKGSKEGLSLYGLFQHLARTAQGKLKLKQWFLRPCLDLETINDRHNAISVLGRPDNEMSYAVIHKSLKSIVNARLSLIRLKRGIAGGTGKGGIVSRNIWSGLLKFCYHAMSISNAFSDLQGANTLHISPMISNSFDLVRLDGVGSLISQVIDFEESAEQNRAVVKAGLDEELDEWKRFYAGVDDLLSQVAKELANTMPSNLPLELNTVYFPQIGFLVSITRDEGAGMVTWEGDGDAHWEKMFTTESTSYYKTDEMREMDERFGDVVSNIYDREIELVHELAQKVLGYEDMLAACSDICGDLDCLVALTKGAQRYNLNRPCMSSENIVNLRGCRHLLQELTVPHFISNSTSLQGGSDTVSFEGDPSSSNSDRIFPSILLLTGPNQSGKSVHLQSMALSAYLAQIGSFIPASSESTLGISDKILTRISSHESVSRTDSTFVADCAQLSLAVRSSTPRTLLVLDEFGKGTSATDGAGLAAGILQHLIDLGHGGCPKVLAATHFHEIFQVKGCLRLDDKSLIQFAHMEILLSKPRVQSADDVTYLFELKDGLSSQSFGGVCAALNGIPESIVERAQTLIDVELKGEDLGIALARQLDDDNEDLEDAESVARRFLQWDADADDASGSDCRDQLSHILSDMDLF